jgi:hypothetical protein
MRCGGSRRGPNGGSQQGGYDGTGAGNGPLACYMADGTGRSRGGQCLHLYPLQASRPRSPGNQRIDFVVVKLENEAEVHLGQQRQPSESMQVVSSAQTHEDP